MPAADDLVQIVDRIRRENPSAARRVARKIFADIAALRRFPNRGRIGFVENTRELVLSPWPFIAVYEVLPDEVRILTIRHAAQDWP